MYEKPKIMLQLSPIDKIIEIFGWISVIGIWCFTWIHFYELPKIIPIHYNALGSIDKLGDKTNIFALPVISTLLFVGLTILNKFPQVFNYHCEITKENALYQYMNATRMLRVLKLVIVLIFGAIVILTIESVNGNIKGLGTLFMPLSIVLVSTPIIYFLMNAYKRNRKTI